MVTWSPTTGCSYCCLARWLKCLSKDREVFFFLFNFKCIFCVKHSDDGNPFCCIQLPETTVVSQKYPDFYHFFFHPIGGEITLLMAQQIPLLYVCLNKWLPLTQVFHLLININERIGIIVRRCTMVHYLPSG